MNGAERQIGSSYQSDRGLQYPFQFRCVITGICFVVLCLLLHYTLLLGDLSAHCI